MLELMNYNIKTNSGSTWLSKILLNIGYNTTFISQSELVYDSDGNFYLYVTQSVNYTDAYLLSLTKNGEFRWCKLLKDTGQSLISRITMYDQFVDENNRIHCYGSKNNRPTNSNDADGFYVIFNQDGTVYKNLGYTDNPELYYLNSYGGCLTKDYSVLFGVKWSTTYSIGKPQVFIFDKLGNFVKSLWANNSNPVNVFYDGFSIPETNQVIFNAEDAKAAGHCRIVNYDIATNSILWNMTLNTFAQTNTVGARTGRILFDSDKNMYFIGYLKSNKNLIHIIKMNSSRTILWSKSYYKQGLTSSYNGIQGMCIKDSTLYLTCYCADVSTKHLLSIDCSTGNINKQWKNKLSYGLNYLPNIANDLYTIGRSSDNTLILTKLSLYDLSYYKEIELENIYDIVPSNEYISSDVSGTTITNYSDMSFTTASYLTSTPLSISDTSLTSQSKLKAVYY